MHSLSKCLLFYFLGLMFFRQSILKDTAHWFCGSEKFIQLKPISQPSKCLNYNIGNLPKNMFLREKNSQIGSHTWNVS